MEHLAVRISCFTWPSTYTKGDNSPIPILY